ncbi:MAG: alpha/beta hydrolase fold domain-containing protein [Terrimesophilobacter sp.]
MVTVPSGIVPLILRATRRNKTYLSHRGALERVSERALTPLAYGPPKSLRPDVSIDVRHENGWPIYTLAPSNTAPVGSVVYLHGGGWVNEIAKQQWHLAAQIAAESSTVVTVPIYPLIPFATSEDVVTRTIALAEANIASYGSVALAGDSAGGQIALCAALALRDKGITLPATVLISPAVDLTFTNPRIPDVQPTDPWLAVPGGRVLAGLWAGERDVADPVVSPLFGDFTGLGPLAVYSGQRDILNPDARLLVDKAKASGVDVYYAEVAGQVHVYPLLPTTVGAAARRDIAARIAAALQGGTARGETARG